MQQQIKEGEVMKNDFTAVLPAFFLGLVVGAIITCTIFGVVYEVPDSPEPVVGTQVDSLILDLRAYTAEMNLLTERLNRIGEELDSMGVTK